MVIALILAHRAAAATAIDAARPDLLLLLVIYWSLSAPRIAGLMFAWLCGLAIDVLKGTMLGQHALAFLLVGFLTHKFQLRMRIFPIWQQTLTVLLLLLLYRVRGVLDRRHHRLPGHDLDALDPGVHRALLWPVLVAVLRYLEPERA